MRAWRRETCVSESRCSGRLGSRPTSITESSGSWRPASEPSTISRTRSDILNSSSCPEDVCHGELVVKGLVPLVPQRPQSVDERHYREGAEQQLLYHEVAQQRGAVGERLPVVLDHADAECLLPPGLAVVRALALHEDGRDDQHVAEDEERQ